MRKLRCDRTAEERQVQNKKTKERKRAFRENQTTEEREVLKKKDKERKKRYRENQTIEERKAQKEKNKDRMTRFRIEKASMEEEEKFEDVNNSPDIVKRLNEIHRMNAEETGQVNKKGSDRNECIDAIEDCVCDIDINCPYCLAQNEAEKGSFTIITKEEAARFDKEELDQYKIMKRNERKEKRKSMLEKFKKPLPPLPVRELSVYEKIREALIAQRKSEWEVYEKQWEMQWQENMKRS